MSEQATEQTVVNEPFNPFDDSSWVEAPAEEVQTEATNAVAATETTTTQQPSTQEAKTNDVDYNSFVKENFGFDSVELAKEEFKKVKEFKPEEPKYKTVEELLGEKQEEIFNYFTEKKKIEKLTTGELNKDLAVEIIKTSILQKNKELTPEDADFIFQDKFNYPEKPQRDDLDSDEDYQSKLDRWANQVQVVDRRLMVEAKMVRPELESKKAELKYPEIQIQPNQTQQSQEELALMEKAREEYVSRLNQDYVKFDGFAAQFKDEAVDFTVPFTVSDDEKQSLKTKLEDFDTNAYLASRWITKEGDTEMPNVKQMMADIYLLENAEKIFQKIANEAGSQRLLHHIKGTHNTTVGKTPQGTFSPDNKTAEQKQVDTIWDA